MAFHMAFNRILAVTISIHAASSKIFQSKTLPSQLGQEDLDEPVHDAKAADRDGDHVPPPEDEEEVLVEHIVGKKTESVVLVVAACDCTRPHVAGDLRGEEVAHWVGSSVF